MAQVTIGGVEYTLAPLGFKKLRQVALSIDKAQLTLESGTGFHELSEGTMDILKVFAAVATPEVTPEALEEAATVPDMLSLPAAFKALLEESGFKRAGEQTPGAE